MRKLLVALVMSCVLGWLIVGVVTVSEVTNLRIACGF